MTQIDSRLPATLRRRTKDLAGDGYNDHYLAALQHAADELETRRACESDLERTAVDAMSDNRRLRKALMALANGLERTTMSKHQRREFQTQVANTLTATREIGKGRRFLTIEIRDADTSAEVLERVGKVVAEHFAAKRLADDVDLTVRKEEAPDVR